MNDREENIRHRGGTRHVHGPGDSGLENGGAEGSSVPMNSAAGEAHERTNHPAEADLESLRAELEETRDRLLRQAAEFQNFRRRTLQERDMLSELGKSIVVERVLEVLDDLERSVEAAAEMDREEDVSPAYQALRHGVELVHRKLLDELARLGVEPIDAVGRPFNEEEHEALVQQPAPEGTEPGIVLAEIQKGYKMSGRVLRHSRVIVSH